MRFDASKPRLECALRTKHGSVETHLYIKGELGMNSVQYSVEVLYILTHARFVWIKVHRCNNDGKFIINKQTN
jgi:hypothetical protein